MLCISAAEPDDREQFAKFAKTEGLAVSKTSFINFTGRTSKGHAEYFISIAIVVEMERLDEMRRGELHRNLMGRNQNNKLSLRSSD